MAQGRAVEREREAIRILKPQARGEGCEVSYDVDEKINYFREWTIGADEKIYQAKDTDFVDEGAEQRHRQRYPVLLLTDKIACRASSCRGRGSTILCESEEVMTPYDQEKVWHIQERHSGRL